MLLRLARSATVPHRGRRERSLPLRSPPRPTTAVTTVDPPPTVSAVGPPQHRSTGGPKGRAVSEATVHMRLRFLLLSSALLLGTWSCRSASTNDNPPAPLPESQPVNPEPMGSATDATMPQGQESSAIPAAAPQDAPSGQEPSDSERMRLIQERQRVLAAEYIRIGDQALAAADLDGALKQFSNALDVMPSSTEARDRLHKVEALMGNRFAQASDFIRDAQDAEVVRRAQARLSAEAAR